MYEKIIIRVIIQKNTFNIVFSYKKTEIIQHFISVIIYITFLYDFIYDYIISNK